MRWVWRSGVVAGGIILAAGLVGAQIPAPPAAPVPAAPVPGVPPVPGAPVAPAAAPAAAPGFFAKLCAGLAACRAKICASPAGAFLNNATKPLTFATGGIFPPFCPIMPSPADLEKPGVAGTADAIKKDALEAKMRRDKVRFLGTVDCRYYPDAIGALIAALRTDGSECVRFEAALALGHGCCCNEKTIKALDITVAGSQADGNPAERSVRVRCAAAIALERCLSCYVSPPVEVDIEKKGIEGGGPEGGKTVDATGTPNKLPDTVGKKPALPPESRLPSKETVEAAYRTLNEFNALLAASRPQGAVSSAERSSVYQIIRNTAASPEATASVAAYQQTMANIAASPPLYVPPAMTGHSGFTTQTKEPSTFTLPPAVTGHPTTQDRSTPEPRTAAPATPAPTAAPVAPAAPATAPVTATGGTQATLAAATASPSPVAPVIVQMLQGATPAERHAAIRQLVKFDWQKNPVVVSALLAGAKSDPAPVVRVDCLRHLAVYKMAHPQVLAELTAMTQDADPWVREEANKALDQLKWVP